MTLFAVSQHLLVTRTLELRRGARGEHLDRRVHQIGLAHLRAVHHHDEAEHLTG